MKYLSSILLVSFLSFLTLESNAQSDLLVQSEGLRSFWFNPATIATKNKISVNSNLGFQAIPYTFAARSLQINAAYKCLDFGNSSNDPIAKGAAGLMFNQVVAGFSTIQTFLIPFNVQFNLNRSWLSIGAAAGYRGIYNDYWFPPTPTPDPSIPPNRSENFTMDLGINWFSARHSLGFAVKNLVQSRVAYQWYETQPTYYLNGSCILKASQNISGKGLATFRTDLAFSSLFLMAYVNYAKLPVSLGFGARDFNSPVFGVYGRLKHFSLGYFMEIQRSKLSNEGMFTHELRIAFEIFDRDILTERISPGFTNF
ncbi:type IX secretion system membrane protein PorP/SprF [Crocinitomix sp.]|nr:type IX secretion system membrane protein PorP/SprF [Crocinitomix sp.]